jgi:equilibrative nucleoside transporter 1/2/3
LDLATSGKGGVGPYIGICAIVSTFGIASANVQGGMVGELSFMLPELIQVSSASGSFNVVAVFVASLLTCYLNAHCYYVLQSFLAGLAAAGTLTSVLRLLTKAAFEKSDNGLRKGASM